MPIFYHGTNESSWADIQKEGVLWGGYSYHKSGGKAGYRYTYLTPDLRVASGYGDVILEVEYDPVGVDGTGTDNYMFQKDIPEYPPGMTCWQFSVFKPIPLSKVRRRANA